jgi:hypothetical protein
MQQMLQRGGNVVGMKQGRRFQMDAGFIFAAYVLDSRRRIASVSVIAASNTRELSDAGDVETITVKDVLSVIEDAAHEI